MRLMRTSAIIAIIAVSVLVACSQSNPSATSSAAPAAQTTTAAAANPSDPVSQKLQEMSGKGATDCGRVKSQGQEDIKKASDCAMDAARDKKAFYVAYEMPGLTVGVAGNSEGKNFAVQATEAGGKSEVQSAACPADLRLAQSGRVTCMSPGSMGGMGASPHGAMPSAGGENTHGGMMAAPPGTPNPHGPVGTKPKSQAPPKQ